MAILRQILPRRFPAPRRPRRYWLPAATWLWVVSLACAAQPTAPSEYQVKAVFLFNFAQFVEWPASAFASPEDPLVIGVLGRDPFGALLDEIVQGERIGTRSLSVVRYSRAADVGKCHILFISRSEDSRLREIVRELNNRPILTVGDMDDFARRGGMILLASEKNRIRLRVNLDAARATGLTLSSKLLRPAEIITTREEAP